MTITNTTTRKSYVGDGATTSFPTTFPFFGSSDLLVLEVDTVADTVMPLTEGVEYTVTGGGGSTGTVEATTAPSSDKTWVIERITERTQQSDYSDQASVDLERLETDFDRNAARDLEVDRDLSRAIRFPQEDDPSSISAVLPKVSARADQLIGFDSSGNVTAVDPSTLDPDTVLLGAFTETLLPLATKADWKTELEIFSALSGVLTVIGGDVLANRPAAASFGVGIYFATDTGQHFFSNGSVWAELGNVSRFALASLPSLGSTSRIYLDTTRHNLHVDDGSAVRRVRAPFSRGEIGGLQTTHATGDITIAAGHCRVGVTSDPDQDDAILASSLQKLLTAEWAEGTGNGGRASGVTLTADTWYHLFLLLDPDNGNVDAGFDTSITATNLLSDTLSAGYTKFQRIWSGKTEVGSTDLRPYIQFGDICIWSSLDTNGSFEGVGQDFTAAGGVKVQLNDVPPGVRCKVFGVFGFENVSASAIVVNGDQSVDAVPDINSFPLQNTFSSPAVTQFTLVTNVNGELTVRVETDTSSDLRIDVHGYEDFRGKHD